MCRHMLTIFVVFVQRFFVQRDNLSHISILPCTHTYMHTWMYIHARTHIQTTHMHKHTCSMRVWRYGYVCLNLCVSEFLCCIYVFVHVSCLTCTNIHWETNTCIHAHMYIQKDMKTHALDNASLRQTLAHAHIHIQTDTCTCTHTYSDRHTYIQTDTRTCTHTHSNRQPDIQTDTRTCKHTHLDRQTYIQTDTQICIKVCSTNIQIFRHTYIQTCIHANTQTSTHT